jgi:hypothetical protein
MTIPPREDRCDSAITVKVPLWVHDALCRKALVEYEGNVSGMIRAMLTAAVAPEASGK